ncbi:MAG: DMT family transporter [Methanobacteriota archaeon]
MSRRPYLAVGLAVASVSSSSVLILGSASAPVTIALYRLAIASAILAPIAVLHPARPLRGIARRDALLMALVGLVLAAHFGFWITSLRLTSVASSTILVTSHPLLVGLMSHFVLRERLTARASAGILLGIVGVVAIALADSSASGASLEGDLLAFMGGVMAGLYFLLGRAIRQRVPLLGYALVVYACAAAFLLVFAIGAGGDLAPAGNLPRELALFLAMALVPQIGGHTLYNWALRYVTAPVVSLSLVGEPIGSSLLAWALLAQTPSPAVAAGGALALVGIYLAASGEGLQARSAEALRDVE